MEKINRLEIVFGILAVLSIVIVAVESLVTLSENVLWGIYIVDLCICVVFAWEFINRFRKAENKKVFMKNHGFEILAMVPAIGLYALTVSTRISAGLRSLRLIRVVRLVIVMSRMRRFFRTTTGFLQRSKLIYLIVAAIAVMFIGGYSALLLEANTANAQITSFSEALWWSISTITTVGYGDIVPHSYGGRVMGMVLMVVGIGIMAALISQVSSTIVESRIKTKEKIVDLRDSLILEVKKGIDQLDKLTDKEVDLLVITIRSLRETNQNSIVDNDSK